MGLLLPQHATYSATFVLPAAGQPRDSLRDVILALRQAWEAVRNTDDGRRSGTRLFGYPVQFSEGRDQEITIVAHDAAGRQVSPARQVVTPADFPWNLSGRDVTRYFDRPAGARLLMHSRSDPDPRTAPIFAIYTRTGGSHGPAAGLAWHTDARGCLHHRVAALSSSARAVARTPFGDGKSVAKATPAELVYPDPITRLAALEDQRSEIAALAWGVVLNGRRDAVAWGMLADLLDERDHPEAAAVLSGFDRMTAGKAPIPGPVFAVKP
jgi:hypothetical protein